MEITHQTNMVMITLMYNRYLDYMFDDETVHMVDLYFSKEVCRDLIFI